MYLKRILSVLFVCSFLTLGVQAYEMTYHESYTYTTSDRDSRYDYAYRNPRRQSLDAYGRYIFSSAKVRYVHSPSRLKGARHAARIDYNNRIYEND